MEDLLTLAEAAGELGLAADTLRTQVQRGRLAARMFGKTYVTTRGEVERYRRESLGQAGRPAPISPRGHRKGSEIKRRKGDDATKTDMSAEGPDGQVYGG
jgi:excisionase family DNA binding protein